MRAFTKEQLASMDLDTARTHLENAVYEAAALIEKLEYAGKVDGNGHHARQKIAALAGEELASRWRS
jgi:hypothetical protein